MTRELPAGTVTFLFTDVEGSTRLLRELGDAYADVLGEHRRVLREAFAGHGGVEVDTQGDAFFVAFAKASDALGAAVEARDALAAGPVRVRMGLHTGEPVRTDEGYVGIDVHRAARIAAAGHGGQILVSQSTRDLAGANGLRDLGEHRLKDLTAPERIYQLGDDDFPALKSLNQTNLPVQPTLLVGRERELGELAELLSDRHLVTLTGPGGSGKTRLALQVAADLVDRYADGVWFVSLAAVRDAELIEPTIAQILGAEDLHQFLRGKQALLLLDNLEQLLPAAAPVVSGLDARVLATSRERLNVSGEQEYPVPPLPVDEAVALFNQRAKELKPSFKSDAHVTEIARRLDGLPLALELAAARVKVLTPAQIAQRLEHRLGLLTGGARDAPERQRTLRATIDWSYELLDEPERRLFAGLAVFSGSFDLVAAEAVCGAELDTLASLVEKSLLRQTDDGRFFLLETIREYGLEQLAAEDLQQRHAAYFFAFAENRAEPGRYVATQEVFGELGRELSNLREAMAHVLQTGQTDLSLRLGTILSWFWLQRSHFHDAARWFNAAPLEDESVAPDVRAKALQAAGLVSHFILDDAERAEVLSEAALVLARQVGDVQLVASALDALGYCARKRSDLNASLELHREALETYREIRDRAGEANSLHLIGEVYRDLAAYGEGERCLEESAAILREIGWVDTLRHTVHSLGDLALDAGRPDVALSHYGDSLRMNIEVGGKREEVYCVAGIACVLAETGRRDEAARLWGAVEALERELGFRMISYERQRYEGRLDGIRDDSRFERSYREGSALMREEASAAALDASS